MNCWMFVFPFLFALALSDPVLVVEIAREGVTTPKTTLIAQHEKIKLTEYNDTLSEYGRQQQYLLGLEMRVRYNHSMLNGECNPLDIFAYSVSKESVMLSGQVHLFGICPLFSNHNITPDLVEKSYPPFDFPTKKQIGEELGLYATPYNFMPLPLHSTYNDPVFGAEESDQFPIPPSDLPGSQSEDAIDQAFQATLYSTLAELTGMKQKDMKAFRVYDTVQELLSLVQMQLLTNIKPEVIESAENFIYHYHNYYWNKEKAKKYAALFFNEIAKKFRNAVVIKLNPLLATPLPLTITIEQPDYDHKKIKYFLYEVSDLQIYNYVKMMDVENESYIAPSSLLIFELHPTCKLNAKMNLEEAMACFNLDAKFNDVDIKGRFCNSPCKLTEFMANAKAYFGDLFKL